MPKIALISDVMSKSTIDNKPYVSIQERTRGCTYSHAWDPYEVAPAEAYKDSISNKLILNTGLVSNHGTVNIPIRFQRNIISSKTYALSIDQMFILGENMPISVVSNTSISIPGAISDCPFFVKEHSLTISLIEARLVVSPISVTPASYTLKAALYNDSTVISDTIQTIGTIKDNTQMRFTNIKFTIPQYYNINLITQIRFYF